MRRAARSSAVILCCFVAATAPLQAEEPAKTEARKVTVVGTATANVKPDAARVTFVITTTETADKSAREANDKHVKTVKDALTALALDKTEVEVNVLPTTITTMMAQPQNPGGGRAVQSKRAQSIVQVTVRDKDLDRLRKAAGKIAETAAENGGTAVDAESTSSRPLRIIRRAPGGPGGGGGAAMIEEEPEAVAGPTIEWQAASGNEARREAIRRAVKEAQADAEAATGSSKLAVVEVHVSGSSEDQPIRYRARGDYTGAESALIPLRIEVRVTYSY